jgi:chorismate mutase/prephenate dehydratase
MELEQLRATLDGIDGSMLRLFTQRMETIRKIAACKSENNSPIKQPGREREILARVSSEAGEEFSGYAKILFSTLLDLSRSYQSRLLAKTSALANEITAALASTPPLFPQKGTVACQGIDGAYSQIACDKLFSTPSILFFKTFEGVFNAVEQGLCDYGILPIENSSYGSVNAVYDLMKNFKFHIIRSIKLQINHALLANSGAELSGIREIVSHEQALGQCSRFLKEHKDVKVTVCENTAVAASMVAQSGRQDLAAISSPSCARLYGLSTISDDIQNSDSNYTRFICIAKDLAIYPGASRISLMLTLPHTPGSLYAMIAKFSALGLNITKIESRPIAGRDFEFLFYFDLDAPVYSPEVLALLGELSDGPEQFVFLGSYTEV